jgi:ABC-type multidrug transport system ATPase subunit
LQQLVTYKKNCGTGTLISSHILDFIEKNADKVALMKDGGLIYFGALNRLYQQFAGHKLDEIYFKLFMKNKER